MKGNEAVGREGGCWVDGNKDGGTVAWGRGCGKSARSEQGGLFCQEGRAVEPSAAKG